MDLLIILAMVLFTALAFLGLGWLLSLLYKPVDWKKESDNWNNKMNKIFPDWEKK